MNDSEKQAYIERMKSKYVKKDNSKLEQIRELDRRATLPAVITAYTLGVIGALVFGAGMCFAMKVIGDSVALGVILGIAGICVISVNYPLYRKNLEKGKKKYEKEILSLIDGM